MKIFILFLLFYFPIFCCTHCNEKCISVEKMITLKLYYEKQAMEFYDKDEYKEFTYTLGKVHAIQECIEIKD